MLEGSKLLFRPRRKVWSVTFAHDALSLGARLGPDLCLRLALLLDHVRILLDRHQYAFPPACARFSTLWSAR